MARYLALFLIACGSGVPEHLPEEQVCWDLCPTAEAVDHIKRVTPVGGWYEWCTCHCPNDYWHGAEFQLPVTYDPQVARDYFLGECR